MVLSTRLKDAEMMAIIKVAINMLKKSYGLDEIIDLTNLTEAEIRSLAQANGLEIKE